MARIFTTPAAEQLAKTWLAQVTVAGGIRTDASISINKGAAFKNYAAVICNELVNRDFNNIDSSITGIANYYIELHGKNRSMNPGQIAKCIVYMAELVQLYWDDTVRTPYEVDEFKKTILGNAVYTYGRYISAIRDKSTKSRNSGTTSSTTATASNQQPKNGYKQSGPQSGNARDLKGQAGEKIYAEGPVVYRIIGDNPNSKNVPNVFVNPLSAGGAAGSTNKVSFSSGNGYSDCTCYFDDPNEANNFLDKIIQNNRVPVNVSNARVAKCKADPNGYFIVGTEFGDCAISAKKLNEALSEAMNVSSANKRGADWEKATEGYTKEELDELHTWMRRD